jgi:hypothetical protein
LVRKVVIVLLGSALALAACSVGDDETVTGAGSTSGTSGGLADQSSTAASDSTRSETQTTDDVVASIRTPSRNIHCDALVYGPKGTDAEMRCFIEETSGPDLPRPQEAQCDWEGGRLFALPGKGPGIRASFCDVLGPPAPEVVTLEYGSAWRHGPYTCLSSRLGLLCTNSDGHGLFLSRVQQQPF